MTDVQTKASDAAVNDELPNGLKVLLFVAPWASKGWPNPYDHSDDNLANHTWWNNVRTYFGEVGFVLSISKSKSAAFLKAIGGDVPKFPQDLAVIGFIATEDVINNRFKEDAADDYTLNTVSPEDLYDGDRLDGELQAVVLSSLSPVFEGAGNFPCRGTWLRQQKIGQVVGDFEAAQVRGGDIEALSNVLQLTGGDLGDVVAAMRRHARYTRIQPTSFLVPGLIPRGSVTLLLGNRKVGKSALALELAVAVARREASWAAFPIKAGQGYAVYLAGEDTTEETLARVRQMTGGTTPYTLWLESGSDLDTILEDLQDQSVALLMVDPARKYYTGDEDGSDAVSGFFTKLEHFARKKNAAVMVTHHLKRYAQPKNASDVANHYRGSGVFLDRPRVTLAMHRNAAGTETQLAIPVLDGTPLHNFRQSEMFSGVRRLRRDEKTFRHVPIGEATAGTTKEVGQEDTDRIFEAARGLLAAGERLTRTGPAALFERKLPQLAGLSRATVRAAVDALVSQGRLNSDGVGVLTLHAAANDDEELLKLLA